jgi:hypothetical protein
MNRFNTLCDTPDTIIHRLEVFMREARSPEDIKLHMANHALVIEYQDNITGYKKYDTLSEVLTYGSS